MQHWIIVEDEVMVAKRLMRFIQQITADAPTKLHHFHSIDDARDHMANHTVDLLFLDLNLGGMDGFELLKDQLAQSFHTIVVSANTDRAIEAFELGILDFVAKPFTLERVATAISRAEHKSAQQGCRFLTYRKHGVIELLPIEDIAFIKAAGHYSEIITHDNRTLLHDKNIEKLNQLLPKDFFRVHRSYLVPLQNCEKISTDVGSKYWLWLKNGEQLPVGRTRVKALKAQLI